MDNFLQRPVVLHGVRIGRVVDVILAAEQERPIGFEIRCDDGRHRFLPAAAAVERESVLEIESPFSLLDPEQLEFYRERGLTLRTRSEPAA